MKLPAIRKASKNDEFHRNITPGFILERKMVNYDHLPRSCTGSRPDGSLADRIGWVITHPDLHAQVLRRTRDIPNAAYNKAERRFRSSHESTCPEPAFDL